MLQEFKEFAMKGNFVDMAVGIVIGAAFSTIAVYATVDAAKEAGAVTINYGIFINAMITFLIVAFALFIVIKGMNKAKAAMEEEAAAEEEAPAEPSDEAKLLAEIRDALAK